MIHDAKIEEAPTIVNAQQLAIWNASHEPTEDKQLMTPKFLHQEQWTDLDLPYLSVNEYGSYRKHPPTMHQLQWI